MCRAVALRQLSFLLCKTAEMIHNLRLSSVERASNAVIFNG